MKKTLTILLLFMGIHPFGTIQLYSQDYLNIKYTDASYKYALINDISEITFNAGGTEMTVTLNDASSNTDAISTIVEATFDASILGGGSPLPVELVSFTADLNEYGVKLLWKTATEVNNYGFEIERRNRPQNLLQGWDFQKIGFVEGHGNSNSPKEYSFTDLDALSGTIEYRLKQIDTDGWFKYSNIVVVETATPKEFKMSQNYPNPFNPTTVISYSLPKASNVTLKVYNTLGQEVVTLINGNQAAGSYKVTFSATGGAENLSSGIYFYIIRTEANVSIKKMILLR